jgi:hypothetical protein
MSSIPVTWNNDPLATAEDIAALDTEELRSALEALATHKHLFPGSGDTHVSNNPTPAVDVAWTTDPVATGVDVQDYDMQELIDALKSVDGHYHVVVNYDNVHTTNVNSTTYAPGWTYLDDVITQDVDNPTANIYEELRTHLEAAATHTHDATCSCECTCTCTCTCQSNCGCTCDCTCTCTSTT